MTTGQVIAFAAIAIPSVVALGWLFFRTWEDFFDAVLFVLTPDIISFFRGRLSRDWWAEFKFGYYIMVCLIMLASEKWLIETVWTMWS